jgi:sugar phosphate isomerase/epimerase
MLAEIKALGFDYVELSHGTKIVLVEGILRAVEEGMMKISSTHNFCPLPMGITHSAPNLFEPSVSATQEYAQWLRHTKRSIEFSARVGATAMVTHLGSVHFFWSNPVRKVKRYLRANPDIDPATDEGYRKILTKACNKLRNRMPAYWEQVQASLEEVRAYALEKGVMLGCENREKFQELPVDADYAEFIKGLDKDGQNHCGYWHDTGHAALKEQMGLLNHKEHLEQNIDRLIGFHLHDVADGDDHQPIGYGDIDFDMISSMWQPEHKLTLELSPRTTPQHVKESRDRTLKLIDKRFG